MQRSVQYELVRMQPKFKQDLLVSVAIFQKDVDTYMEQFDSVSNLKNCVQVVFNKSMYSY